MDKFSNFDLKNCPFCNGIPLLYCFDEQINVQEDFERHFQIECQKCLCSSASTKDKNIIIKLWNKRIKIK